ncbi:protein FAM124A [Latimeria chalumnae]|uniref:protein FAM124A n=1 Tax=Latimeria chalumnae TaxID=7897 RepID=UPI0003C1A0A9
MEKSSAEDECGDSGAETGGEREQSGDRSVEDLQDPFLVSVHIITDPGNARTFQNAIDNLLAWINPELQLFRVSERGICKKQKKSCSGIVVQPALAVILFLQEEYGEEQILQLYKSFQQPPWRYHHTEHVQGKILPYMPCNQDFFTLANGTPLWAIRQVHYGKEIVRFTIYCSYENFADMVRLYKMIVKKEGCQRKLDFCFFTVYSNMDIEIQFSLKRLPKGQYPTPTESAVLEFRVKDIGQLVPLLPNPCTPISEVRWQTEDYDGNKILLQVPRSSKSSQRNKLLSKCSTSKKLSDTPLSFPPRSQKTTSTKNSWHQKLFHRAKPPCAYGLDQSRRASPQELWSSSHGDFSRRSSSASDASWTVQRSKSLFCLPSLDSTVLADSSPFFRPQQPSYCRPQPIRLPRQNPSPRLTIDDLKDAEETDIDTGFKLSYSDLSVVSAYSSSNGFCKDLEAALSSEVENANDSKHISCRTRPFSVASDPLSSVYEFYCSSLPSLSELSSSSFVPAAQSSSVITTPPKLSQEVTTPLLGSSQTAENETLPQKHETSLTQKDDEEEEFYI